MSKKNISFAHTKPVWFTRSAKPYGYSKLKTNGLAKGVMYTLIKYQNSELSERLLNTRVYKA